MEACPAGWTGPVGGPRRLAGVLRAHGPPASDNIYLINGAVADRGQHAVEILCVIFG